MNLAYGILENAVQDSENQTFLTDLKTHTTYSYESLLSATLKIRRLLEKKGVQRGDRIAFLTINEPSFYPVFFACASLGAITVPLGADTHKSELKSILSDCSPILTFIDPSITNLPLSTRNLLTLPEDLFSIDLVNVEDGVAKPLDCDSDEDCLIIYTSGTSGNCKGILLSHKSLWSMAHTFANFYQYGPQQRFLSVLPYYHINAIMITGLACIVGRSHIFLSHLFGPLVAKFYWDIVEKNDINVLSVTPSIMAMLLSFLSEDSKHQPPSQVKFALVGTAPLPSDLWQTFEDRFGIPCYQGYGLTETTTWATLTPPSNPRNYNSVGVPVNCEIAVSEETDFNLEAMSSVTLPAGTKLGEIVIRGDIVMKGYFKKKKLTKRHLSAGWFKSGDIGYIGADNHVYVLDRIKNIIKRKGSTIFPSEIDEILRRLPNVEDSHTFGIEDPLVGEKIVSACVTNDIGEFSHLAQTTQLTQHLRQHLSAYKIPDTYLFLPSLPRNKVKKTDVKTLKSLANGAKKKEIIQIINEGRFRRWNCKDDPQINQTIQNALYGGRGLRFSCYWGCGRRSTCNYYDRVALDHLQEVVKTINHSMDRSFAYCTIILTDVHVRSNRVPDHIRHAYFSEISAEATERGLEVVFLSEIWEKYNLDFDATISSISSPEFEEKWNAFADRDAFIKQAEKRLQSSQDIRRDAEEGAKRYYAVISTENEPVAQHMEGSIFITYNGPDYKRFLPRLPTIHWYSQFSGTTKKSDKPWFTE